MPYAWNMTVPAGNEKNISKSYKRKNNDWGTENNEWNFHFAMPWREAEAIITICAAYETHDDIALQFVVQTRDNRTSVFDMSSPEIFTEKNVDKAIKKIDETIQAAIKLDRERVDEINNNSGLYDGDGEPLNFPNGKLPEFIFKDGKIIKK